MSSTPRRHRPAVWSLTGLETAGLFEHLNTMVAFDKESKQTLFYLIGLVLYQLPEDQREAAMQFAHNFVMQATSSYNEQLRLKQYKQGKMGEEHTT